MNGPIGDGLNCDLDDMIYVKLKVNIIFYQFHDRLLIETSLLQSLKPLLYMSFNDINHAMARLLAAVVSRQQFNSCLSTTSDTSTIQSKPKRQGRGHVPSDRPRKNSPIFFAHDSNPMA